MKSRILPLFFDPYNQTFVVLYIKPDVMMMKMMARKRTKLYPVNTIRQIFITGKDIVSFLGWIFVQLNPFNVCACVRPVEDFPIHQQL
jgi:hypothetical protein